MTKQYHGLDRSLSAGIFLASLLVAFTLLSSVTLAFGPMANTSQATDKVEEVIIQG